MRRALGYRTKYRQRTIVETLPAPIGGLNNRDALASMPNSDAYFLENWFPTTDGVVTRNGNTTHVSGIGGTIETLAVYSGGSANQLISFNNGKMFNVTAAGAPGPELTTGRTSNKNVTAMFSNAATHFLIGVNGADTPFSYNGTAYAALTITGITGTQNNLAYVFPFKGRLYLAAINELVFYYLAVGAIQGAATSFDLSQIASKGGYLMAIGSITLDTGSGPDDFIAFVTSEGEVLVYKGTDPSAAATFALVGRYSIGRPIGRKCISKYGGDALVITDMGLTPLSMLFKSEEPTLRDSLSSKLGNALISHNQFSATHGWHVMLHPANTMLILNVPHGTGGEFHQYVMNTITGAWCVFNGWKGYSFAEMNGNLYYGAAGGKVYRADTGSSDDGVAIVCNARTAYNYFEKYELKHWHNARLHMETIGNPELSVGFNIDYIEEEPSFVVSQVDAGDGELWDVATWDVAEWAGATEVRSQWADINDLGFTASTVVRVKSSASTVKWFATEYLFEYGGVI